MKVLLCEDVKALGWRGEMIEVSAGYARNYLLPQGLVVEACGAPPALVKELAEDRARRAEEIEHERKRLQELASAVNGAEAVIASTANEQGRLFGSVNSSDIAANLAEQGFEISADEVHLEGGIKQVGTHAVRIRFAQDLSATVNVVVVDSRKAGALRAPESDDARGGSGPKEKDESESPEKSG